MQPARQAGISPRSEPPACRAAFAGDEGARVSETADRSLPVSLWLGAVLAGCSLTFIGVAVLAPRIVAEAGLAPEAVGLFSGAVWAAALLASLASGQLVLRWGPWTVVRLCLLACAAGLLAVALGHPALFWAGAVLIGIGQGLEAPPSSQLLGHHVAAPRRPLFFSLKQTGVQVGAVLASLSLPALALAWGWRAALAGVVGLLLLLVAALARPARRHALPPASGQRRPLRLGAALQGLVSWMALLRHDRGLLRLALAAAAFGATQVCMNTFLVTWMVSVRGVPLTTAGLLAATAQGAGLLGRPLWGWVASRAGGSRRVLLGLGALMAASSALLGLAGAGLPAGLLAVLAALFGLSASGWNGVFLAEVASRSEGAGIAAATAAAMVPLFLGLIVGPVAFAGVGRWLGLSSGFVMMAGVALAGTLLVPPARR